MVFFCNRQQFHFDNLVFVSCWSKFSSWQRRWLWLTTYWVVQYLMTQVVQLCSWFKTEMLPPPQPIGLIIPASTVDLLGCCSWTQMSSVHAVLRSAFNKMKNMDVAHKAVLLTLSVHVLVISSFLSWTFLNDTQNTMIWHKILLCNTVTSVDCGCVCGYQAKWIWSIVEKRSSCSCIVPGPSCLRLPAR